MNASPRRHARGRLRYTIASSMKSLSCTADCSRFAMEHSTTASGLVVWVETRIPSHLFKIENLFGAERQRDLVVEFSSFVVSILAVHNHDTSRIQNFQNKTINFVIIREFGENTFSNSRE